MALNLTPTPVPVTLEIEVRVRADSGGGFIMLMMIIFNSCLNVLITFIIFLVCFLGFWANKQRYKSNYDNQALEMV